MGNSVFTEISFWLIVAVSAVMPFGIYGVMLALRAISRSSVLMLGFTLVVIAGVDVYFLQSLAVTAKFTASLADDAVFISEVSIALYLLPAMSAGIGINVISHILISHLVEAERSFAQEHPDPQETSCPNSKP